MKIFKTEQIRQIDAATMRYEPISSIDLMERAARTLTDAIMKKFGRQQETFAIFAGPGNNGGDALAIARMLTILNEKAEVWLLDPKGKLSPDCEKNFERLKEYDISINLCNEKFTPPTLPANSIIIDGIFGSGLNKPAEGIFGETIRFINSIPATKVAIDIPSGLHGEKNSSCNADNIVHADYTLTLQFPKLAFFMPENDTFVGKWEILNIGLSNRAIDEHPSGLYYTEKKEIAAMIPPRKKFSHKGDYGHALLIAGSQGMAGAAILSARATLRSGVGLLSVCTPMCNNTILQTAVPEAMTLPHCGENHLCELPTTERYTAIAAGPGLGTAEETEKALLKIIDNCNVPMVLDADALNILSKHPETLDKLPANSIITPHPGEFARLTGGIKSREEQLEKATELAQKCNICIVLKGAYTAVCSPDGSIYFNSSGNPGMATAGSGDTLTGIAVALLARGHDSTTAARIAVYIHGLAGDIAAEKQSQTALTAGDIIDALPSAWKIIEQ
jgi:NAD(P)H-hydrate epimerase